MRKDPRKFRIGQVVRAEDIARRVKKDNRPGCCYDVFWMKHNLWAVYRGGSWHRPVKPFNGIIVGATRRQEGMVVMGSYDEPNHFEQRKSVLLWKVATSYLGKPVLVFEEDIMPVSLADFNIPWSPSSHVWTENERRDQSNEMKQLYQEQPGLFPRDEKGRFCKLKPERSKQ